MVTIVDVAREAGVSTATVSRVLNNNLMVSDEKVEKVERAIEKLGYVRADEKKGRTAGKNILLICSVNVPEIIEGIVNEVKKQDYQLLTVFKTDASFDVANIVEEIYEIQECLAGILLLNIRHNEESIRKLKKIAPVVVIGEHICCGTYVVCADHQRAFRELIQYLAGKGRKQIALIIMGTRKDLDIELAMEIKSGYIQGILEQGMEYDPELIEEGDFTFEGGYEAAKKLVDKGKRIDAICCISNKVAIGCLRALADQGLHVPDDIMVCGAGNTDEGMWTVPSLTSIEENMDQMGRLSIQLLDSIIRGGEYRNSKVYVEHQLIERESTDVRSAE